MNIENLNEEDLDLISCEDEVMRIPDIVKLQNKPTEKFPTGFKIFNDAMRGGFKPGDLTIISGRSGQGKTTFAQTLTYHLCKEGIPCLWFSYEVSLDELDRKFREMKMEEFYSAYAPKKSTTGKIEWLKSKIKEGWIKHATKIVVVDHIDFLTPSSIKTSDNEQIALKKVSTELKSLAIELDIVIIVMAHLKKIEETKDPGLYDIGYSAGIFQLADYVFMVNREKSSESNGSYTRNTGEMFTDNSIVKIVKNRDTGTLNYLRMNYSNGKLNEVTTKFEEPNYGTK